MRGGGSETAVGEGSSDEPRARFAGGGSDELSSSMDRHELQDGDESLPDAERGQFQKGTHLVLYPRCITKVDIQGKDFQGKVSGNENMHLT